MRTPGELQPSQGAQTAPHSRGLVGGRVGRGSSSPASPWRRSVRPSSAVRSRLFPTPLTNSLTSRSPLTRVAPSRLLPTPLTPGALTHHPFRAYPIHPRSRPTTARLQALASDFWPVPEGSTVRTGHKSDPKRVVAATISSTRSYQMNTASICIPSRVAYPGILVRHRPL